MDGYDRLPEEAVLLASLYCLGQVAGEWLRASGFSLPAGEPLDALRRLLGQAGLGGGAVCRAVRRLSGSAPPGDARELLEQDVPSLVELERICYALADYWESRPLPSTLAWYGEDVDVCDAQGRWELLVLALLLGGPVGRERVESTFCRLRREGLLAWEQAVQASPVWQGQVEQVLEQEYRGPIRRAQVRERLVRAAAVLVAKFGGDLEGVWQAAGRDPGRCVGMLRESFEGMDRTAAWLLREMGRKGAWPDAHRHPAAVFVDRYSRMVLENLGLLGSQAGRREAEQLLRRHFARTSVYVFYQGRERCAHRNVALCLKECPVRGCCRFLRGGRQQGLGEVRLPAGRIERHRPRGRRVLDRFISNLREAPPSTDGGAVPLASKARRVETGRALTGVSRSIV